LAWDHPSANCLANWISFYWPDRQFNVFEHGKIVDVISGIQKLSMVKYLIWLGVGSPIRQLLGKLDLTRPNRAAS
jgi:hypothetical protein